MGEITTIGRTKLRILKHSIEGLKEHSRLKIAVVIAFALAYWFGSFFLFRGGFHFVERFLPGLGDLLINRLFYLFFLATFIMLVFSNMILVYSLAYKSREVDFLSAMPLRHTSIFQWKFAEALFFSSWASVFMAGPLILAYGIERSAGITYYLAVGAFLLPFILIAAGLGASVIIVLVRFFPRRKFFVAFLLVMIALAAIFVAQKPLSSSRGDVLQAPLPMLDDVMRFARFSRSNLLPSTWLTDAIVLEPRGYLGSPLLSQDKLFGLGMLWSNGLMGLIVCFLLADRVFYSGWSRSKGAGRTRILRHGGRVIDRLGFLWKFMNTPTRAMVTKDLRIFWRDPAQWSQFVIFFGLLGVYILNLRNMSYHTFPPFFKNSISFMNLAATALTLGTLTTRFIFPQMSLEGNKFWVVGLAPISVESILAEKFLLCFISSIVLAGGLTLLSGLMLGLDPLTLAVSSGAMLLTCFGLSGLSVGLGAIFPNFGSDNPARIVSGFGGTLALVLSLTYITIVLAAEFIVSHLNLTGQLRIPTVFWGCIAIGIAVVCLSVLAGMLPMKLGAKHLKNTEF